MSTYLENLSAFRAYFNCVRTLKAVDCTMLAKDLSFLQVIQNDVTVFSFELFWEHTRGVHVMHVQHNSTFTCKQDVKVVIHLFWRDNMEAFSVFLLDENRV